MIGSAAGVAVGLAFTRSLTGATGHLMETMFGVPANTRDILIPWWFLLGAFAAGVVTSMIRGADSGTQCGAARTDSGTTEGPLPGARRG